MDLNPLLAKELETGARRWPTYALRMSYLAILLLGVWIAADLPVSFTAILTVSRSAQIGRDAFLTFALIQFWGVTLHAVLVGADLFAKEIRSDTLGLLALTFLSPGDLVRGKWLAAVAQSATLLFCGLPVLAACAYLGGADGLQTLAITAAAISSVLFAAALAVLVSAAGRSLYSTAAIAMILYALSALVALVPARMLGIIGYDVFRYLHPVGTLASCLGPRDRWSWLVSAPLALVATGIVLKVAEGLICLPDAFAPRQVRESKEIVEREEYYRIASENLGRPTRNRPVWNRFPLLWKEIRTRAAAHVSYQIRLVVLGSLALIVGGSTLMGVYEQNTIFQVYVPIAILLTIAIGSGLYTRDREQRRWEALLATPATTGSLILAKLLSGPCSPEGATVLVLAVLSPTHLLESGLVNYLHAAGAFVLFLAFAYAAAALASLLCRTQRAALLLSAAAVLFILIGIPYKIFHPYDHFSFHSRVSPDFEGYAVFYFFAIFFLMGAILLVFTRVSGRR